MVIFLLSQEKTELMYDYFTLIEKSFGPIKVEVVESFPLVLNKTVEIKSTEWIVVGKLLSPWLIMHIPGEAIFLYLKTKTFEKLFSWFNDEVLRKRFHCG